MEFKYPSETGNNEWYTPSVIIEGCRKLMGSIDLDPASCDEAQKVVQAAVYYTKENDGLLHRWNAFSVFLNPPYGRGYNLKFTIKLIHHLQNLDIVKACLLVPADVTTKWYQLAVNNCDCWMSFNKRVNFWNGDKKGRGSYFGSTLFMWGIEPAFAVEVLGDLGLVYAAPLNANKSIYHYNETLFELEDLNG